jgi:hypothetical protein
MKIELIKKYKFGAKLKDVGTQAEVTQGLGNELISKGIAIEFTGELKEVKEIKKKKEEKKEEKNVILQNNEVQKPHTKEDK